MNERLIRFTELMRSIFELDKSDLDFGIYRIMNIRKNRIEDFLTKGLPRKVQETLKPFAEDSTGVSQRMKEIENTAKAAGIQVSDSPVWAAEYEALKKKKAAGTDLSALETDVYSALYSFFNRYYDEGDFISKRRYKEGVYAIPYEGEEVKLYWANHDQYYIKTSENFKDYAFIEQGISVHFRLVDATTEKDNIKEADDSKRVFMLFTEDEENYPGIPTFEYDQGKRELIIRFVFDIPEDKKRKYAEENYAAIKDKIVKDYDALIMPLLRDVSKDPKKPKTVLQRHLEAYVAKNTFDYFIHKDLGGFLRRELDFYIKNEVMRLDDLDTENEQRVETWLAKVRAIKRVGHVIIDFLAQLEDFQKKLWLKKKFVVETNWCITLDRIDQSFWPEIAENEQQVQEWMDLYAIQEAEGWTNPPSMEFLKNNQNLLIDTRHFTKVFKNNLLATFDHVDKQMNGLLINADNYQAARFLSKNTSEKIKCVYLDPPYNTNEVSFLYKNNYKHSSWISMISDRVAVAFNSLSSNGVLLITIDDEEVFNLKKLLDSILGENRFIGTIVIQSNPRGRGINSFYATCHEYCLCYAKNPNLVEIVNQALTEEQASLYTSTSDEIPYRALPFRRSGGWSTPSDRPNSEFPLYFNEKGVLFAVGGEREIEMPSEYVATEILTLEDGKINSQSEKSFIEKHPNAIRIMPVDTNGSRRVWRWSDRRKILEAGYNEDFIIKQEKDYYYVQLKDRIKDGRKPKTIWFDSRYDSSSHGTNLLKSLFGERNMFGFPKSVFSTEDSLCTIIGNTDNSITLDLFAGSATTGHAVLNINRRDNSFHKYILVEMGTYFDTVTKPRMQKVIYSDEWKDGKPQNRDTGVSHLMKYIRLESYEDALSNIRLDTDKGEQLSALFGEEYLVRYMIDTETADSLLDIQAFRNPFQYQMKITENNEARLRPVDVVETFNYLIGLRVARQGTVDHFRASPEQDGAYEGAVHLARDDGGEYAFQQVEGTMPDGRRALIIWRTVTDDLIRSNAALDAYFTRYRINPNDREYDVIFVNGDNNLDNIRGENEQWESVMTELEFKARMFEGDGL